MRNVKGYFFFFALLSILSGIKLLVDGVFDDSQPAYLNQSYIPVPHEYLPCPNRFVHPETFYVFLCAHKCLRRGEKCKSFNYQAYLGICEICPTVASGNSSEREYRPGWEFATEDQYSLENYNLGPCTSNPCQNNGFCYTPSADDLYSCSCKWGSRFIGQICDVAVTDGGWGEWAAWSECTASCNAGYRTRTRQCDNPAPGDGGETCPGSSIDYDKCHMHICPVWSMWSWLPCEPVAGSSVLGVRTRTRTCLYDGTPNIDKGCIGNSTETEQCHVRTVSSVRLSGSTSFGSGRVEVYRVNRQSWGTICNDQWDINDASVVCKEMGFEGAESAEAVFERTNSLPIVISKVGCNGNEQAISYCNYIDRVFAPDCTHDQDSGVTCYADGGWGSWSPWSNCSEPCAWATRTRTRECDSPAPLNGGNYCTGNGVDQKACRRWATGCNCTSLGFIEHGTVTGDRRHKRTRNFQCDSSSGIFSKLFYSLVGEASSQCFDSQWTHPEPLCKESCELPKDWDTENCRVSGSDPTAHTETAQVLCNPFHEYHKPKDGVLTCNDGYWEPTSDPECEAISSCEDVANTLGQQYVCVGKSKARHGEAVGICNANGGHLVTLGSLDELRKLMDPVLSDDDDFPYWIGMIYDEDDSNHPWINGADGGFRPWESGQPRGRGCVQLEDNGEISVESCSRKKEICLPSNERLGFYIAHLLMFYK
ncbi:SCO-spondin-like [Ptychodera flava]|uniref:SCO-spondin-like n=1 Tax=Ptychodera flava TaxID=63121 RepID=UPI00396A3555